MEVHAHVKVTRVMSLYAHVVDVHASIDIRLSSASTVSCVQDVCDSVLGQIRSVLCTLSEKHSTALGRTHRCFLLNHLYAMYLRVMD